MPGDFNGGGSPRRDRPVGRPMTASARRGPVAAWGAMIGPDTPPHGPSTMRTTGRGNAVYGRSTIRRGHGIAASHTNRRSSVNLPTDMFWATLGGTEDAGL